MGNVARCLCHQEDVEVRCPSKGRDKARISKLKLGDDKAKLKAASCLIPITPKLNRNEDPETPTTESTGPRIDNFTLYSVIFFQGDSRNRGIRKSLSCKAQGQ